MRVTATQRGFAFVFWALASVLVGCSKAPPDETPPKPTTVGVVQSASTTTGPNCSGAGDPTTGQTGAKIQFRIAQ